MLETNHTASARCPVAPEQAVAVSQTVRTHRRSAAVPREAVNRRSVLQGVVMGTAAWQVLLPPVSRALELSELITQAFPPPPQPVLFPRKALDQRFAVLLMRSGYDAVDALDFMPTDKFQIAFWKQRQSEQEAYGLQYSPIKVRQGDLTDPLYFDYISYSQYTVVGREMPRGQQVFQEFCDECEPGETRLVRRDPALADNKALPAAFDVLVGDFIYKGLKDGFRDEVFGAPAPLPAGASVDQLAATAQELLNVMVGSGYALKAEVCEVTQGPPASFKVRVQGPANLWSLSSLAFRRSPVINSYSSLTVAAFLRASGRTLVGGTPSTLVTETGTETTFVLADDTPSA